MSLPESRRGRGRCEEESTQALGAFAVAGAGLYHKICHVLGGAYDLPHAGTHTVVLPQVVAFNQPAVPSIMRRVAGALGGVTDAAAAGVFDLIESIGVPTALGEIGVREEDLDEAVSLVLEKAANNPRPVDEAGVRAILEGAFGGHRSAPVAGRSA